MLGSTYDNKGETVTFTRVGRTAARLFTSAFVIGGVLVAGTSVASAHVATLYVSPSGHSHDGGYSCRTARYRTIQSAVDAAPHGATVVACKGTYAEDVVVARPLTLLGLSAVIQGVGTTKASCLFALGGPPVAAPCLAGVTIESSHVEISGFTVTGAVGEGILGTRSLSGSIS